MSVLSFDSNTLLWLLLGAFVSGYAHILLALLLSFALRSKRSAETSGSKISLTSPPAIPSPLPFHASETLTRTDPASETKSNAGRTVLGGLISAATWIGGKLQNEDRVAYDDLGTAKLLIIADGVSGSDHGSIAAEAVIKYLRQSIREALVEANPLFDQLFFYKACETAARHIAEQIPRETSADSTIVVLLELPDRIVLAYLGDGGAVWVRGNQRDGRSLLLAQHDEYGRLSGFVGAGGVIGRPTVLHIQKSDEIDGAIFAIGSDGALPRGKELSRLHQLLQTLSSQAKIDTSALAPDVISNVIETCLVGWKPDDNASLGLLFTREALAYWQQQVESSRESFPGGTDGNFKRPLALVGQ